MAGKGLPCLSVHGPQPAKQTSYLVTPSHEMQKIHTSSNLNRMWSAEVWHVQKVLMGAQTPQTHAHTNTHKASNPSLDITSRILGDADPPTSKLLMDWS